MRRIFSSHGLTAFSLLMLLAVPGLFAQTVAPTSAAQPSMDEILRRLQENLWDYQANVPDFFADEHVVSTSKSEGARDMKTTTDSTFRLVRSHGIGEPHTFTESREVKLVNKKSAKGEELRGPAIFTGAFSTGLSVVSLEGSAATTTRSILRANSTKLRRSSSTM